MPLNLPDASPSTIPAAPTASISGGINNKRIQNVSKLTDAYLLAYMTERNGTPYSDTAAISATHTVMLSTPSAVGTYSDITSNSGVSVTASAAKGYAGSPDARWNPAIDGDEGYTVVVTIPKENLTTIGLYTIRLEVESSTAGTFHQIWELRVNG